MPLFYPVQNDWFREKGPTKFIIMVDAMMKKAAPVILGISATGSAAYSYLAGDSLVRNKRCSDPTCSHAFRYMWQRGPNGGYIYRTHRICSSNEMPPQQIRTDFADQTKPTVEYAHRVSIDMDRSALQVCPYSSNQNYCSSTFTFSPFFWGS